MSTHTRAAPAPIRALIFDFDGLLVDTETPAFESWRRIYAEFGEALPLELWKEALGSAHGFDALAHLRARQGDALDWEALRARRLLLKADLSEEQPLLTVVMWFVEV
jgi:beta-phosphoglucomutase-like phosphatase (HAD superfamily)